MNICISLTSIISLSISLFASVNYFIKYANIDLRSAISALFSAFITMGGLYTHIVAYLHQQKIINVLTGFQNFCDLREF